MFYSYYAKTKNGWSFGNAQLEKVPYNIFDIMEVEKLILKNLQKEKAEVEEVKILNFQKFF